MKRVAFLLIAIMTAMVFVEAQTEKLDYATIGRIRDEGLTRSQVMDHVSWLSDVYGPRLTGSPAIQQASEWAMKKFSEWGLANPHQERWKFGKGWSLVRFSAHLVEPQVQPLIGFPIEWSAGTKGPVTGDVVRVQIANEADFAKYRGKLAGKILLAQPARQVRMLEGPIILRMDDKWTGEAQITPVPAARGGRGGGTPGSAAGDDDQAGGGRGNQAAAFRQKLSEFAAAEGALAIFERGSDSDMAAGGSDLTWQQQHPDGGTIFPAGAAPRDENAGKGVPRVTLAVEHYNRMIRVLDKGLPVKVELNVEVKYHDPSTSSGSPRAESRGDETGMNGFNTVADMPGSDLASEIVLLGAHFDSHPYATGATDNATGSAAMMEAVRILKAVGVKPRRTIRIALWGGEEQGLLGSRAYVREHLADIETMTLKPDHAKLAAYFNSDNGTGRVRGIWMQGNLAVRPIFEQWIAPLRDLGVTILSPRSVSQTDHLSFDNAGLPAFQFLVDRLEYNSRTHHSNMDTMDRVQRDDMIQQATVIAVFAYNAAMRDEKLPRKALPAPQRGRSNSQ
jgi:carboxypeptidase Q